MKGHFLALFFLCTLEKVPLRCTAQYDGPSTSVFGGPLYANFTYVKFRAPTIFEYDCNSSENPNFSEFFIFPNGTNTIQITGEPLWNLNWIKRRSSRRYQMIDAHLKERDSGERTNVFWVGWEADWNSTNGYAFYNEACYTGDAWTVYIGYSNWSFSK